MKRMAFAAGVVTMLGIGAAGAVQAPYPTSIEAHPVLVGWMPSQNGSPPGFQIDGDFAATLTSGQAPLRNRTLTFAADGVALCTATTDADGLARCDLTAAGAGLASVLAGGGYDVSFAGETDFLPSTGRGVLATTPV